MLFYIILSSELKLNVWITENAAKNNPRPYSRRQTEHSALLPLFHKLPLGLKEGMEEIRRLTAAK